MLHYDAMFVLLIATGVCVQWVAWRLRMPAFVLLAFAGVVLGPVTGLLAPQQQLGPWLEPLINMCVAMILFEAGLHFERREIQAAGPTVWRLVSLGVLMSGALGAIATVLVGDISWPIAILLGGLLVVTGPEMVLPLMRHVGLETHTAAVLKCESILVDPLGALIAVLIFEYLLFSANGDLDHPLLQHFLLGAVVAVSLGAVGAWLMVTAHNRGILPDSLTAPVVFGVALGVFLAANLVQAEAGLVAVTVMGIVTGWMGLSVLPSLRRFEESVSVILVSVVLILLTAALDPALMDLIDWRIVVLVLVLGLLVRPFAVAIATVASGLKWRKRALIGGVGPPGLVAAASAGLFGPRLVAAGYPDAQLLVPLVFAVIVVSIIATGAVMRYAPKRLGLGSGHRRLLIVGASRWTTALAVELLGLDVSVLLIDPTNKAALAAAQAQHVPVMHGEPLSERAEAELDHVHTHQLLAATTDDVYNALLCTSLSGELGSRNVYQLPPRSAPGRDDPALAPCHRGVFIVNGHTDSASFERLFEHGWHFRTELSGDTTGVPIAYVGAGGAVRLASAEGPSATRGGEVVVAFAPPASAETWN